MKKLLLFATLIISMTSFAQTDIFFSEYVEGSDNSKALEIYNPTSDTIDLSNYLIVRFSNGEGYPKDGNPKVTAGGYVELEGTLAPGKCHVLVNSQTETTGSSTPCNPELQKMANQLDAGYPSPTYMNGNDAIALLKYVDKEYYPVDIFGQFGLGSTMYNGYGWAPVKDSVLTYTINGEQVTATISDYVVPQTADGSTVTGPFWMAWSKDHSLIRKPNVLNGTKSNPDGFNISTEWDTLPAVYNTTDSTWSYSDIWTNLGTHTVNTNPDAINQITTLQFNVFPNPITNNTFTLTTSIGNIKTVEAYNMIGQSLNIKVSQISNSAVVKINQNINGIIIVKVIFTDNAISTKKVIIK